MTFKEWWESNELYIHGNSNFEIEDVWQAAQTECAKRCIEMLEEKGNEAYSLNYIRKLIKEEFLDE